MSQVTPTRNEIPVEHTWDTESIFASVADWETAVAQLQTQLDQLAQFSLQGTGEWEGLSLNFLNNISVPWDLTCDEIIYCMKGTFI